MFSRNDVDPLSVRRAPLSLGPEAEIVSSVEEVPNGGKHSLIKRLVLVATNFKRPVLGNVVLSSVRIVEERDLRVCEEAVGIEVTVVRGHGDRFVVVIFGSDRRGVILLATNKCRRS